MCPCVAPVHPSTCPSIYPFIYLPQSSIKPRIWADWPLQESSGNAMLIHPSMALSMLFPLRAMPFPSSIPWHSSSSYGHSIVYAKEPFQSPSLTKIPFLCPQVPFILIPFLKVTVLVRYNSYSTKFTLLKYTIQWYIQSCAAIATIQFQNIFQPTPQRNPVPISSPLPFSLNSSSPCNQESCLYRFPYSVGFA